MRSPREAPAVRKMIARDEFRRDVARHLRALGKTDEARALRAVFAYGVRVTRGERMNVNLEWHPILPGIVECSLCGVMVRVDDDRPRSATDAHETSHKQLAELARRVEALEPERADAASRWSGAT